MIFFVAEIGHFAIRKCPKQHGEGIFAENFLKNLSPFMEEESYEVAQLFWRIWAAF
jgi:hypothetical protein